MYCRHNGMAGLLSVIVTFSALQDFTTDSFPNAVNVYIKS